LCAAIFFHLKGADFNGSENFTRRRIRRPDIRCQGYNSTMSVHPVIIETINTTARSQMIDITDRVEKALAKSAVKDGLVVVFVEHTTAAVSIQENDDPDVQDDLLTKLERLVPQLETYYLHDEGNSDAHLKSAMLGSSVTAIVDRGRMLLGRWQGIYFLEIDGTRERRMAINIVGG
jgi:secondary thiamine-phosphate synthase enzyme